MQSELRLEGQICTQWNWFAVKYSGTSARHHSQSAKQRPLLPSDCSLVTLTILLALHSSCAVPGTCSATSRSLEPCKRDAEPIRYVLLWKSHPTRGLRHGTEVGPPQESCILPKARRRLGTWTNWICRLAIYIPYYCS